MGSVYWIEAKRRTDGPAPTTRQGHFTVRVQVGVVDAVWRQIRAATETGELGYKAKVSTAARGSDANERLIYVATYDADDAADIERVRRRLLVLVPDAPIAYQRA